MMAERERERERKKVHVSRKFMNVDPQSPHVRSNPLPCCTAKML